MGGAAGVKRRTFGRIRLEGGTERATRRSKQLTAGGGRGAEPFKPKDLVSSQASVADQVRKCLFLQPPACTEKQNAAQSLKEMGCSLSAAVAAAAASSGEMNDFLCRERFLFMHFFIAAVVVAVDVVLLPVTGRKPRWHLAWAPQFKRERFTKQSM